MASSVQTQQQSSFTNQIVRGDCIEVMRQMPANSVDFVLTDPPYLVNYRDRDGRTIQNDANADWLKPAMAEAYRVLKQDRSVILCSRRPTPAKAGSFATSMSRRFYWRKAGRHCRSSLFRM
jgi:DNA modification methylase